MDALEEEVFASEWIDTTKSKKRELEMGKVGSERASKHAKIENKFEALLPSSLY